MSSSEINNVKQISELDQVANSSISRRETRDEAIERFKLAKELLDNHRPKNLLKFIPQFQSISPWMRKSIIHNRNSKFDKLLYKIFLNKEKRAVLHEHQEIFRSHKKSEELYAMLVETTMAEFSQYKTFEIINDLRNPEHNEFVCINPALKEPYLTDRETYVGAVKHTMLSNPDKLNKVLTKTIAEKIALLSLESNASK